MRSFACANSAILLILLAAALFGVGGCSWIRGLFNSQPKPAKAALKAQPSRANSLARGGAGYDLLTPAGIHVKTNGQYKTEAQRQAAAQAIDRYWRDVRECAVGVIPPEDHNIVDKLLPEFPSHLSIEIARNWEVIQGPVTHSRQQAFPSLNQLGAWVTASREEEALYVKVVPELNGLGRQMAGELNLWLSGHTSNLPTDFSNRCGALPCHRFDYDNSPSEAWVACN